MTSLIKKCIEKCESIFLEGHTKEEIEVFKREILLKGEISNPITKYEDELLRFMEAGNLFSMLSQSFTDNSISLEEQYKVFKMLYNSKYRRTLFWEGRYLIDSNCVVDSDFIDNLFDTNDYSLLFYLIKNNGIFDQVRNRIPYQTNSAEKCEKLLKIYKSFITEDNRDEYDIIFNDLCFYDNYGYGIYDFIKQSNVLFNDKNLVSLYNNIYLYGIKANHAGKIYNRPKYFCKLLDGRIENNNKANELYQGLATLEEAEDKILYLKQVVFDKLEEKKEKINAFKKTKY